MSIGDRVMGRVQVMIRLIQTPRWRLRAWLGLGLTYLGLRLAGMGVDYRGLEDESVAENSDAGERNRVRNDYG